MKRPRLTYLCLLLLAVQPVANAEDNAVYESHTDVTIGRVFLSPADRQYLDSRRHLKPSSEPTASDSATTTTVPQADQRPAGGYIKGPNGQSRVWQDSAFVATAVDTDKLSIPGRINIVRHVEKDDADDED